MNRFEGKVVAITGGARGIGEASVRRFAAEGAKVAILDIDPVLGNALAEELGASTFFVACDHSQVAQCDAGVAAIVSRWGRLDVLFNNAAGSYKTTLEDCPDEMMLALLGSTLLGPWRMTRSALPELKKSAAQNPAGSVILFTGSRQSGTSAPANAPYTVAKHGVVGLVKSLAIDTGPYNIRVNAVCPGIVPTPRVTTVTAWGDPQAVLARYLERTPLKRITQPEDIASAAAYLASDEARAISGQALYIDGGMTAQ